MKANNQTDRKLTASGILAAGLLMAAAVPAAAVFAEETETPVENIPVESVPADQGQETSETSEQDPVANQTDKAEEVSVEGQNSTEPAQSAKEDQNPAAEEQAGNPEEEGQPAAQDEEQKGAVEKLTLDGDAEAIYTNAENRGIELESENSSPLIQASNSMLNPGNYPLGYSTSGSLIHPDEPYKTQAGDIRFVTDEEAQELKAELDKFKSSENPALNEIYNAFAAKYPVLAEKGQTPLVNDVPKNVGYYYVIPTEQAWYNVQNYLSGHYDADHNWHPQFEDGKTGSFNVRLPAYSMAAIAVMGAVAQYRITPALVSVYITGNQTGDLSDIDFDKYQITAYPNDDVTLQDELNAQMKNFHPERNDFEFNQDPNDPTKFDVDLSTTGIKNLEAALGSNFLMAEIIADDAVYKINEAGQYVPETQVVTVLQLDKVQPDLFIKNLDKLPEDAEYSFLIPEQADTRNFGDNKAVDIIVKYKDGSSDTIKSSMNVLPRDFVLKLNYVDQNGNVIETKELTGQTGSQVSVAEAFPVPASYHLAGAGMPATYLFEYGDDLIQVVVIKNAAPQSVQTAEVIYAEPAVQTAKPAESVKPASTVNTAAGFSSKIMLYLSGAAASLAGLTEMIRRKRH